VSLEPYKSRLLDLLRAGGTLTDDPGVGTANGWRYKAHLNVRLATKVNITKRICLLNYRRTTVPQRWWARNCAKVTLMGGDEST